MFQGHEDVGRPPLAGAALFDTNVAAYTVTGGGENMWFTNDAFHFVWRRVSGDLALRAAVDWVGTSTQPHRKACLMIRESLDPSSPYVDVAIHGDGLTSLQFRDTVGGPTREIQANTNHPAGVGLRRQGNVFFMTDAALPARPEGPEPVGPSIRVSLPGEVYVGLAVCAHDAKVVETARFSRVVLERSAPAPASLGSTNATLHCTLETVNVSSKDRRAIYHTRDLIEAPNWSRDGRSLWFNSRGRIWRLPVAGGSPQAVDTGTAVRCNNDHGLSPDGTLLAISDQTRPGGSRVLVLPAAGGQPRELTPMAPSYWHGWSPDGLTFAYCAERGGNFDIYTMPVVGGGERRLTTVPGLDDGPDYSPDGQWIYFNSDRSGLMQIWRMKTDGSDQQPVTTDENNNWFPHPSPDGKWLAFLTYDRTVTGHPANQPVRLRLLPMAGGPVQELAHLFGGQGTINVPSWSPDSRQLAFVSYEWLAK